LILSPAAPHERARRRQRRLVQAQLVLEAALRRDTDAPARAQVAQRAPLLGRDIVTQSQLGHRVGRVVVGGADLIVHLMTRAGAPA
jgi:hypothetical protein